MHKHGKNCGTSCNACSQSLQSQQGAPSVKAERDVEAAAPLVVPRILQPQRAQGRVHPDAGAVAVAAARARLGVDGACVLVRRPRHVRQSRQIPAFSSTTQPTPQPNTHLPGLPRAPAGSPMTVSPESRSVA
jgi:hypothetical protein